ncbi:MULTISPECIES: hypothetical protein [unclassified Nocardioides]|jgi:hypothetical protein|uniref:hypothetical protein n=1 Tax=unclassified Nocardioides TaxID=2615069 RepID=UPI0007034A6F|nr:MULTISPECIES: hypothetical protein [unclassified Nocardioides]KRC59660.1 hypothetical protein ASE19_01140 [Nocardioides sp. Root79]KRC68515.1 hypothetical protein ASE20_16820 [Nocardioides sp. Root240]
MADTAPPGFVARNNQVIGSILSILALVVAVLLGAGLMFGTDTRGVRAILTVLTVAGGTFTLLLLAIGGAMRAVTSETQWELEEAEWRKEMGLTADDEADVASTGRLAVPLAVGAIVIGLGLSVVPAVL